MTLGDLLVRLPEREPYESQVFAARRSRNSFGVILRLALGSAFVNW
jgi:hypothetical protein